MIKQKVEGKKEKLWRADKGARFGVGVPCALSPGNPKIRTRNRLARLFKQFVITTKST